MATQMKPLSIEGARLIFRNFSGEAKAYNPEGRRNFCILLEPEMAEVLANDGWNVKMLQPREEGDEPQPYLQVAVNFKNVPPKIVFITSKNKTVLDEESIDKLDWIEIANADVIISPYKWSVQGKEGIKAYLKSLYITAVEDEFESKYYDVPEV